MEYSVIAGSIGHFYAYIDPHDSASAVTTKYTKNDSLMQYTGLKDKNGEEIYEGDIVRLEMSNPPHHSDIKSIVWDDIYLEWAVETPGIDGGTHPLYLILDSKLIVIGNIYENPELLAASREPDQAQKT